MSAIRSENSNVEFLKENPPRFGELQHMFEDEKIGSIDARVVVVRQKNGVIEFFVVKDRDNHNRISFPGGGCERGESISIGATRELLEEAGILVHHLDIRFFRVYFIDDENHSSKIHAKAFFWCHDRDITATTEINAQGEAIFESKWISAEVKDGRIYFDPNVLLPKFHFMAIRDLILYLDNHPEKIAS